MPKLNNTRKQRARELYERLQRGGYFSMPYERLTEEEYNEKYKRWFKSWVEEDLLDLIPELKEYKSK